MFHTAEEERLGATAFLSSLLNFQTPSEEHGFLAYHEVTQILKHFFFLHNLIFFLEMSHNMYFNHLYFKYDNQFGTSPIAPVHPASFSRHHHRQLFCLCHLLRPFFSLYFLNPGLQWSISLCLIIQTKQNAVDFQKISEVSQIIFQQEMKLSRTFYTHKWASKQSLSRQR